MNNPKIKQGKSNRLQMDMQKGQCALLHKFFAEKLICYDTYWPLSRMNVEIAVNQEIHKILNNTNMAPFMRLIDTPTITSIQPDSNSYTMEYITGKTLLQIFSNDQEASLITNLNDDHIKALVHLLNRISKIKLSNFSPDIQKCFKDQTAIVSCMYQNKLKNYLPILPQEKGTLCLGDVSINNLLFDGKKLYLIDFECAHFGYPGYDYGQILGMTKAYSLIYPNFTTLYTKISSTIQTEINDICLLNQIKEWEDNFFNYYTK